MDSQLFKDTNPNRLTQLTTDVNDAVPVILNAPFYVNYYYDGIYQPLFGIGGGLIQYGSCRVDEENRVVVLDEDFKYDQIIFECIVSPEKNGDYRVPLACQEAVIAFIKWKDKQGAREDYIAEKISARRRMPKKKAILQTINQIIRESESMEIAQLMIEVKQLTGRLTTIRLTRLSKQDRCVQQEMWNGLVICLTYVRK